MSAPETQSPLARHLEAGRFGAKASAPGVAISQRRATIVQLIAGPGEIEALRSVVRAELKLDLPDAGCASNHSEATAIWIAPSTWLVALSPGIDITSRLRSLCGPGVAVVDQSGGKTILRLSGPRTRDVLAKGCRVDLHPRSFGAGRAAVTPIAHVPGIVMQVDSTTFDVIVPSTLAVHVFEWICLSAAEFGYETCV